MSSSSLGIRMKPELKLDYLYRFIQLENGEFEFSLVTPFSPSHRAMSKDRKVIGAGYITVFDKRVKLMLGHRRWVLVVLMSVSRL